MKQKLNVVIPMAGLGSRFKERGFETPKHLIKINHDKPMIEHAIRTLTMDEYDIFYYFVIRKETNDKDTQQLKDLLKHVCENQCEIVEIDYVTEGPASTVLLTKEYINNDIPLIVSNCDQIIDWNGNEFIKDCLDKNVDGSVVTYKPNYKLPELGQIDKHSFIQINNGGYATRITEKIVISDKPLVGIHYYKHGKYFVDSCEKMIQNEIKYNNEFYISMTYNVLISHGKKVNDYKLKEDEYFYPTGTPDDLFEYLEKKHNDTIKIDKLSDTVRGWFIGHFENSVYRTNDFEVGYLFHKKGEIWQTHFHAKAIEINLLVKGHMTLNKTKLNEGDIFTIVPNQLACPIFHEDCYIVCIKVPSVPEDKYLI